MFPKSNIVKQQKKVTGAKLPEDLTFIRSGKTGNWRTDMNDEVAAKVDEWTRKNIEGTDFDLWQTIEKID